MLRKSYLNTMKGLEEGLTVRDIAVFGLETCGPDERVEAVRRRANRFDFDNLPVRAGDIDSGPIVGVVEGIKNQPDTTVQEVMTPLAEPMLIAGSVSLVRFLPTIADRDYRLVIEHSRIMGVITPSDVVQLPVRLFVFARLIHLEETMRNLILWNVNNEDDRILDALKPDRRPVVERLLEQNARAGLNPSPVDATFFMDKANLMFDLGAVPEGPADRELFREFRDLRNKVDHALDYATTRQELHDFLRHVELTGEWIDRLTKRLPAEAFALPGDDARENAA